jgi:hypothetical protein
MMAKRIYTPKQISPEVARENEIGAVKSQLMNTERMLVDACKDHAAMLAGRYGDEFTNDPARVARQIASFEADVSTLQARVATLMAG